jgi:choice-of-anchor B domain-containing protein
MPRLLSLALLTALLPAAAAQTGGAEGLTLVGQLNPRPSVGYADIWGYVGANGREYALLSTRSDGGMTVIDVTAEPPVEVEYIPGSGGTGSDIEVYGDYVYFSDDQAPTQIYSLADPENPVLVGTVPTDAHTITVAGEYLYTQGGPSPGGVRIYHLANPASPTFVGEYQPHYMHDIHVRGDTMYAAGIYGQGVDIVDLSDRTNPALIARFNYPASGAHNICTTEDGSYAFVGDEIGSGQWTRIFDVRDPMNVTLVGQIIVDPNTTVHNCHVKGDLLYIGYYDDYGARVYDISDPTQPEEIAYFETTGGQMMWSVYPHLPSGKIIGAGYYAGGLYVFRLESILANEPGAGGDDALTLTAAPNPVRGTGTLRFALPGAAEVRLSVYDALGREVAVLAEGARGAGPHEAALDVAALPPGVYLARLVASGRSTTARLTVAR